MEYLPFAFTKGIWTFYPPMNFHWVKCFSVWLDEYGNNICHQGLQNSINFESE